MDYSILNVSRWVLLSRSMSFKQKNKTFFDAPYHCLDLRTLFLSSYDTFFGAQCTASLFVLIILFSHSSRQLDSLASSSTLFAMDPARGRTYLSSSRATKAILRSALALGLVLSCISAVKHEDFKTCAQSGFCTRNRAYADLAKETPNWASPFQLSPSSLRLQAGVLTGDLVNTQEKQPSPLPGLAFELHLLDNDAVRVRINERDPIAPRYDGVQDTVIIKPYGLAKDSTYQFEKDADGAITIQYGSRNHCNIKVTPAPFKLEFLVDGVSTVVLNEDGLLRFERLRKKQGEGDDALVDQSAESPEGDVKIEKSELEKKLEENMWEERFKDNTDSKPRGRV